MSACALLLRRGPPTSDKPTLPAGRPMTADLPHQDSPRHDWTREQALALHALPFADLIFRAQAVLRAYFDPNAVQRSQLLSIKTGGCAESCGYCSQSAHFDTGLKATKLMAAEAVVAAAAEAKAGGAQRFCIFRGFNDLQLSAVV